MIYEVAWLTCDHLSKAPKKYKSKHYKTQAQNMPKTGITAALVFLPRPRIIPVNLYYIFNENEEDLREFRRITRELAKSMLTARLLAQKCRCPLKSLHAIPT